MRDSRAYCECARHTNKRQMSDVRREQHSKFDSLTLSLSVFTIVREFDLFLSNLFYCCKNSKRNTHTFALLCFMIISATHIHTPSYSDKTLIV